MAGKLIIIEGGDGSGKATQTELLHKHLEKDGFPVMAVNFPDYDSESSALVKMYLRGDFGTHADAVNPYAASAFYAVDRVASYERKWKAFFKSGGIVLADRYTTSNMLYQMIKIDAAPEREAFLDWLTDFEFHKLGLPEPDGVVFLDVPQDVSARLMAARAGKTGGQTGDIHENNRSFLDKCHKAYGELVKKYGWHVVNCVYDGTLRPAEAIHEEVYRLIRERYIDKA